MKSVYLAGNILPDPRVTAVSEEEQYRRNLSWRRLVADRFTSAGLRVINPCDDLPDDWKDFARMSHYRNRVEHRKTVRLSLEQVREADYLFACVNQRSHGTAVELYEATAGNRPCEAAVLIFDKNHHLDDPFLIGLLRLGVDHFYNCIEAGVKFIIFLADKNSIGRLTRPPD